MILLILLRQLGRSARRRKGKVHLLRMIAFHDQLIVELGHGVPIPPDPRIVPVSVHGNFPLPPADSPGYTEVRR